jgi:hypothetical protein
LKNSLAASFSSSFFIFPVFPFSFPYLIPHSFQPLFYIHLAGKVMTHVVELEFLRKSSKFVYSVSIIMYASSLSDEASKNHRSCQCCIFIALTGTEWGDDEASKKMRIR